MTIKKYMSNTLKKMINCIGCAKINFQPFGTLQCRLPSCCASPNLSRRVTPNQALTERKHKFTKEIVNPSINTISSNRISQMKPHRRVDMKSKGRRGISFIVQWAIHGSRATWYHHSSRPHQKRRGKKEVASISSFLHSLISRQTKLRCREPTVKQSAVSEILVFV